VNAVSTAPLRVLLLCDSLAVAGGVERFVCGLANHLARIGCNVAVGSVDTPAADVRYPLDAAVQVLVGTTPRDSASAAPGRLALLAEQWRAGRALARLMRQSPADVIVLNGLVTACATLLWALRESPRVVCCDHNHFAARSRLWQRLRAWLYPQVAAVVSLSEADAPRFRALNARTRVIYNASSLQAEVSAAPAQSLVLAVGRHAAQKGFDLLLLAWRRVLDALPAARLRIVGDGPLQAELHAQARALGVEGSVEWLPSTPQIEAHYRAAAIFVLPSRHEGMPLALLEAQALGVAAVAFDCPTGPREIVNADTGIVVPPGDVNALAAALLRLLNDAPLRERMGRAAIARSRAVFSPQQHLDGWTALLREVAK
jgi:glycosyltransferase involved in cell wall biosynthesis